MTTVTEAVKRLLRGAEEEALEQGDLDTFCSDPVLAQRLARRLANLASDVAPGRRWSIEDLRDVFEVACRGTLQREVQVLEGRYFRKRLREHCALAERYGDPFAILVIGLKLPAQPSVYQSVLDAVTDRLRRTDMVFLYKRRVALLLPRMRRSSLDSLIDRVRALVAVGAGESAIEDVARLVFPAPEYADTQAVLDWAEDQLR